MTGFDAGRPAGSAAREAEIERLRRRVAGLEAENAELRRARRVAVELETDRAALRESEERHRLVVESATDHAILTMDLDRRITGWNAGAERVLGWTEAEVLGRPADMIFTPEDREAGVPEAEARGAVERGRAEDVRWHLRRDGSRLWASGVMLPLRDDAGATRGLLKILRDKTAEKRAADELRDKAGFLGRLLESSADRVEVLDLDGRLLSMGEGGRRALGVDDFDAVRDRPWPDFWEGEGNARAEAAVEAAGAGGTGRFQGFARTTAGAPRWWDVQVTPIPGADGRPERLLCVSRDVTATRRAEEAARGGEARLAALARASSDVLYRMDPDWGEMRELRGGGYLADTTGPSRAWLIDYIPADERARVSAAIDAAIRAKGVFELEHRVRRADGGVGWTVSRAVPILGEDGEIVEWVGAASDVTARRGAEEALRESEARLAEERARLAALVEHLPVGVCFVGPDGTPLLSNPAFRRFLPGAAMPSRMAGGEERWLAWDEGGRRLPRERYPGARALRGEAVPGVEFLHRAGDGRQTWTRVSGVPLLDAGGHVVAALVVIADIDEQKRAQEGLRRLNETLEARVAERTAERDRMWRLSTDLMLVARSDAAIAAVNPAWTALLGWREDELVGRSFLDLVHPDDAAATLAEADRLSRGLTTSRFENRYRHKDGGHRWLSWTAVPEAGLIHAVARDVTAERAQAEALAQAEGRLRQGQKMEAVGQLTGGIAHDFNNMLQGIGGAVELARRRVGQGRIPDALALLDEAGKGVDRAAALTHRLLAFARRQALDAKPVVPDDLVRGMAELIGRAVGPGVEVRTRPGDGGRTVLCDANGLENVLLNLAINARDAMPDGGTLTLATAEARLSAADVAGQDGAEPGDYVELCVSDTGAGMDEATRARAFEPFFTTKPIGHGTGLGLSQVYGFVRQSGGVVRLDSAPGRGTTVRLYLPRHRKGEAVAPARAPGQGGDGDGAGGVVVLVEDEAAVRAVAAEALRERGYTVLDVEDGPAGLRLLAAHARVDLLVTDVGLPGMNGRQLAEAARERRPALPVLFITGYAGGALGDRLAPGMEVIGKPFALDALAAKVRGMVEAGATPPPR